MKLNYNDLMMLARAIDDLHYLERQADTSTADKRSIRRALGYLEAAGRRNGLTVARMAR